MGRYVMQGSGSVYYRIGRSTYSNADLQLELGKSNASPFSRPIYDPRTWNGTINYTTSVPEPTTILLMGLGLAGLGFARRRRLNA
ncbi:MAG: PEP-CTERM sorting domain-containing protein [Gammaproteobacteria bacterium]|nr:PEP-CTERM sorting domain-containing protein [Gammaproteobacteria bacterium]